MALSLHVLMTTCNYTCVLDAYSWYMCNCIYVCIYISMDPSDQQECHVRKELDTRVQYTYAYIYVLGIRQKGA